MCAQATILKYHLNGGDQLSSKLGVKHATASRYIDNNLYEAQLLIPTLFNTASNFKTNC